MGEKKPTKNERREQAREAAKLRQVEDARKARKRRWVIQFGVAVGILGVAAIVSGIIWGGHKTEPLAFPENMPSNGVVLIGSGNGESIEAVSYAALKPGQDARLPTTDPEKLNIQIYQDYVCPACRAFEASNLQKIEQLVAKGQAILEIHPISILDRASAGSRYSSRAANAAACVATYSPAAFSAYNTILFDNQPAEGGAGLTDKVLVSLAKDAKVEKLDDIRNCVNNEFFKDWVAKTSYDIFNSGKPVPGTVDVIARGTPTVIVNGVQYTGPIDDPQEFAYFLQERVVAMADAAEVGTSQ